MAETVKFTLGQGNQFMGSALQLRCPDVIGTKKFGPNMQAKINEYFRQLGKCLKPVSIYHAGEGGWIFGLKQWPFAWKRVDFEKQPLRVSDGKGGSVTVEPKQSAEMEELETDPIWMLKEPEREVDIELSPKAKKGIYWLSYFWAKPGSPHLQNPGFLDEIVWPIIEAVGKAEDLSKDLGLDDEEDDITTIPEGSKKEEAKGA